MINVYRPQPLYHEHPYERLVVSDVSIKDHHVRLHISTDYPDISVKIDDIQISAEGRMFSGQSIGHPQPLIFLYTLPQDSDIPDQVKVFFKGNYVGRVRLKDGSPKGRVTLTAATLFKGDYRQLSCWIQHHALLGFERFILYFNGEVEDILPELSACPMLIDFDIHLVSWPFSYWVEGTEMGIEGRLSFDGENADLTNLSRDWHHAQQLMLNHAVVTLRDTTEWLGIFDLDEYFHLPNSISLRELLKGSARDVMIFQSRWAEMTDGALPSLDDSHEFFTQRTVLAAPDWVPFPSRTKSIVRPEMIFGMGAHIPKSTSTGARILRVPPEHGGIYHFHCFSGKASRRMLVNPGGQWIPVDVCLRPPGASSTLVATNHLSWNLHHQAASE